jgi:hypothetical protein
LGLVRHDQLDFPNPIIDVRNEVEVYRKRRVDESPPFGGDRNYGFNPGSLQQLRERGFPLLVLLKIP